MRYHAAILLNLLLPGTGLILTRREWLGTSLAALFGVSVQIGLWGCLIEPARMPVWLAGSGLAVGAAVWFAAQYLLRNRLHVLRDRDLSRELGRLRDEAAEHLAKGSYHDAWAVLQVAAAIDDEDLDTNAQAAELLALLGRFHDARRAWKRVRQLDRRGAYLGRMKEALARLPRR